MTSNLNFNNKNYNRLANISNSEQLIMISKELTIKNIDPYDLLSARPLSLKTLLEKYNILRIKNHPDKGGEKENFITISDTIKNIKDILNIVNNDKQFITLKGDYYNSLKNECRGNLIEHFYDNHEFNVDKFNKLFNELKFEEEQYGYELNNDKIEDYNPEKIEFKDFHQKFKERKKTKGKEIKVYNHPEAYNTNEFNMISENNKNFNNHQYTDYSDAFDESLMSCDYDKNIKQRSLEELKKERLEIKMNDDELKLYEDNLKNLEIQELKRRNNLQMYDDKLTNYSKKINNYFISN